VRTVSMRCSLDEADGTGTLPDLPAVRSNMSFRSKWWVISVPITRFSVAVIPYSYAQSNNVNTERKPGKHTQWQRDTDLRDHNIR
jgi:hypothetical protein